MKRLSQNSVQYETDAELVVSEIHQRLVDGGYSPSDALIMMRGANVPVGLRSSAPILEALLTPEFVEWLTW